MEYRISDTLDCLAEAGQDLAPLGGNSARVKARTFDKLHGQQSRDRKQASAGPRRVRPLGILIAAAVTVLLLCSSAFAARKLGAFRFRSAMGPEGEKLDQYAVTYNTEEAKVLAADLGYASLPKTQAAGYNLILNELWAQDGQLRAEVDVSPRDESLPPFRDSALSLGISGYEADCRLRRMDAWTDRVTLTAPLHTPLPDGTELCFVFTGPETAAKTDPFPVGYSGYRTSAAAEPYPPKYGTAAETKDYRFSLRTLAVSKRVIYAVLDVEGLSEFGLAHLDQCPELLLNNHTHTDSASILDPRLMESTDSTRRYLLAHVRDSGENAPGDTIHFEVFSLLEAGDMSGHWYRLFDVRAEQLLPEALTVESPSGQPETGTVWQSLTLDPLSLSLKGSVYWGAYSTPEVFLIFRDGTTEKILDADNSYYGPHAPLPDGHRSILTNMHGRSDGTGVLTILFARPLALETLSAVEVNGQRFPVNP